MGEIKVLSAQLANMIAAGEVVQRPASVVKELMENAIDAGATQISVAVLDAGRTLIQVADNGCGMNSSDAVLCFDRHATSKISTSEDLLGIVSYGFRGEALASIAAVAEVTLKTRRQQDETGIQVRIAGGGKVQTSSVAAPVGSTFSVRNLFYNTPARRKFLKSDNIELKHIIEEFTRIAITRPDTEFTLSHDGKDIYTLKKARSEKVRIQELLGSSVCEELVEISADTSVVNLRGYIGRPESAKKRSGNQFMFINGRYFRSPYLHKAVMKAYEDLIPQGLIPSYFISLTADPHSIDVNVHPAKTEVKFEDEMVVHQILYACIKESIGKHSFGAILDFDNSESVDLPQLGKNFQQYAGLSSPRAEADLLYDPFSTSQPAYNSTFREKQEDYSPLFEDKVYPEENRNLSILGNYILIPAPSGIMIVHSGRARERIFYERGLKMLKGNPSVTQAALFDVEVNVDAAGTLLFREHSELLKKLGFDLTISDRDSIIVKGVPEGFACDSESVEKLIGELLYILSEDSGGLQDVMEQRMVGKIAYLQATRAAVPGSPAEASSIIDTLFACANPELTPRGHRTIALMPFEDIDKMF